MTANPVHVMSSFTVSKTYGLADIGTLSDQRHVDSQSRVHGQALARTEDWKLDGHQRRLKTPAYHAYSSRETSPESQLGF